MNDSLSFNERWFATAFVAPVTIRIRPYESQHRDQWCDALRSIVPMHFELPQMALAVQDPHDVAERRAAYTGRGSPLQGATRHPPRGA
jgi:hypothetical protein